MNIPYNKPYKTGKELEYIREAHQNGHISGDGPFTKKCHAWLEKQISSRKALLTHSCTAALEMAAILAEIQPGDEIIMPSFTFVSTANAFVLRGGIPVFVDIRPDTLNIDEKKIESAITKKTKAIIPVHYAGVSCEMDSIRTIAKKHNLLVIEDAAQAIMASYKNQPLGSLGHMAALSFHETKNIISGEGGALLINEPKFIERAEIIREKGTDRSRFFRGQVDKYTWQDLGSSFLPSDIIAAFLYAQIEDAENIFHQRMKIWGYYHEAFEQLESSGKVRRPIIPAECGHNAHLYYLLLPNLEKRDKALRILKENGVGAVFHYLPLHSSPAGKKYGHFKESLPITEEISNRLIRLPLWVGIDEHLEYISEQVISAINTLQ